MAEKTTAIAIPTGMTQAQYDQLVKQGMKPDQINRLWGTFIKNTVRGKDVGKAVTEAIKGLKEAHKDEYHNLLVAAYKKHGLDPSTLKS